MCVDFSITLVTKRFKMNRNHDQAVGEELPNIFEYWRLPEERKHFSELMEQRVTYEYLTVLFYFLNSLPLYILLIRRSNKFIVIYKLSTINNLNSNSTEHASLNFKIYLPNRKQFIYL